MEKNHSDEMPEISEILSDSEVSSENSQEDKIRTYFDDRHRQILTKDKFYDAMSKNTWANSNSLNVCLRNIKVR